MYPEILEKVAVMKPAASVVTLAQNDDVMYKRTKNKQINILCCCVLPHFTCHLLLRQLWRLLNGGLEQLGLSTYTATTRPAPLNKVSNTVKPGTR